MREKDAAEMSVEEFKQYLAGYNDEVINFHRSPPGKNNRSYLNKNNGRLFVSASVKVAMQRRRTK